MSKHTPGRWLAFRTWVEPQRNDLPNICNCDPETMGMGQETMVRSFAEQCANARLIAAAPEMHALLTIAVARISLESSPPFLGAWVEDARKLLDSLE